MKILLPFFCGSLAISLAFVSCGPIEYSDVRSTGSEKTFSEWCASSGSTNCAVVPGIPPPAAEWNAGLAVTQILLESPSTLKLTRSDYAHPKLQSLFSALGCDGALSLIQRLPWISLNLNLGVLELQNKVAGAVVEFQGLKLRGAEKVSAKIVGKQIRISGVEILEESGVRVLRAFDLSKPGFVHIVTSDFTISDVPVEFFALTKPTPPMKPVREKGIDVGTIVKAISELALDEEFSWRTKLSLLFPQRYLTRINEVLATLGPRDPVAASVMDVLAKSDQVLVGGASSSNVVSVSRKRPVTCSFRVTNVPVLGSIDLKIHFAAGFGMAGLRKGEKDVLANIDSYGIETNFGKVKSLQVKEDSMVLAVGVVKIPIEYVPKKPSTGPRVESGVCEEKASLALHNSF